MQLSTVVSEFPRAFHEVEVVFIPLSDGTNLSARYWIPDDADDHPVPAILEYIPYCTRDGTAARDEAMHPYFAGHGYAAIRVDMRGSGESDGIMQDEYLRQEQNDALEVIAWIAAQPWCDGNVGMMGKSWGGFNGLQVAAQRPPALKCIISVYSTDDRYADDVHYMGGCLINNNPSWAFVMFGNNARPPDPALVGERWRELWMARLEANRPWLIDWLTHQTRDAYWKHGSVCENYAEIDIPVYAIGGWADGYSNPVPRMVAGLNSPTKALIGPWGHQYMHQAMPGPMMGYMTEALRWWDYWLKGEDTGVMDEPRYRVWMQDSIEPRRHYDYRPGRWVAEDSWPSATISPCEYALNKQGLAQTATTPERLSVKSPVDTGICSPAWLNHGEVEPSEPGDQRADDMRSLCFDGEPLSEALEIFGAPEVTLELDVDQPQAIVAVRLCDISPDGASTRVSYGLLNLSHRDSHESPEPLVPGQRYRVTVLLNDIAHRFAQGHRVRVAVATSQWPIAWPSPAMVTLGLHTGISTLRLPERARQASDELLSDLPPPEHSAPHETVTLRPGHAYSINIVEDIATGEIVVTDASDTGRVRFVRNGWETAKASKMERSIVGNDPLSARTTLTGQLEWGRVGQIETRVDVSCVLWADAEQFHIRATLDAFEDDRSVFTKSWLESISRNGV